MDGFERQLRTYGGIDAAYQSDEDAEESHDARSCINPATRKFLRGLIAVPATHARVLITTRLRIHDLEDKNGDPLEGSLIEELLGLNEKDAVDFMYKQGVKGDYKNIAHVCNNYGNHPLSLRLLSGKIIKDEHKPGNISVASEYESKVHGDLKAMKHHVLEVSYNALTEDERTILSSIAAFRSPMPYEALVIFNKFDDDYKFKVVLEELRERGLVSRDLMLNRYDLHPLVRSYAYKHLNNKVDIHMILRDYFATIVEDIKIQDVQNLEDITLIIELYIHTLYARLYNDAIKLYVDRLNVSLSKLGAYNITIDLLKKFFEKDPDLAMKRLCHPIAKAYEMAGYTRMSAKYYEYEVEIRKKQEDFRLAVIALRNLADVKISLGDLSSVESDLYEAIKLCQESRKKAIKPMIPDKRDCEEGLEKGLHRKLGILLTYEGRFAEAKKEMNYLPAKRRLARQSDIGPEGELSLYKLLIKDFGGALNHANYMLKQAEKFGRERDITFAEWLLGMIHFHLGNLSESEHYLNDAIVRCRTTNRVELEADILLGLALCEYAKHNLQEGISNAEKALDIANNREYRLKQADIHSSLGYLSLDSGNFETAKQHAQTARERSSCDGPPHIYKLALDEANRLLDKIQVITKSTIKSN
jgi:tetratricopeptide (TPR) repeat protein